MYHSGKIGGERKMQSIVRRTIKGEKGSVLIMVLILLVVGGLILTPLLGLMSTGLLAGKVYEKKTDELYAADAGVEDAIWRIQSNNLTFGANNWSDPWYVTVNDKSVEVAVCRKDLDTHPCTENLTYQILSIATTDDAGGPAAIDSSTTVEAYVTETIQYQRSGLMDHIITINEGLTEKEIEALERELDKVTLACREECANCTDGCGAVTVLA